MRMTSPCLALALALAGTTASAQPLAEMAGTWRGSGWARQSPQGPQETMRCKIKNAYDAGQHTLKITGTCVVPGRRLDVSGVLTGSDKGDRITGRWSNPDGMGSVPVVGLQRDAVVAFNFSAFDPATGKSTAQNVEWRILKEGLRLRSSDRKEPDIMMSDITFNR